MVKLGLRTGTKRVGANGIAWIDELLDQQGPEMIVRKADKAIMTRLEANDAVIPANLAQNLFKWGAIDPDQIRVPTMNALNSRLAESYAAQTRKDGNSAEMLMLVGEIMAYLPEIAKAVDMKISGKSLVEATSDYTSRDLAMRARRRR